jgi:hypothetical protein
MVVKMSIYDKFIFKDLPIRAVVNRSNMTEIDQRSEIIIDEVVAEHLGNIVENVANDTSCDDAVDIAEIQRVSYDLGYADAKMHLEPIMEQLKEDFQLGMKLRDKLGEITSSHDLEFQMARLSARLIDGIAKKIYLVLPVDFEQILLGEISTITKKYYKEGKITVKVHAERVDYCTNLLQSSNQAERDLLIAVDEDLNKNDCVVEWEDTKLEYNQEEVTKEIDLILDKLGNI